MNDGGPAFPISLEQQQRIQEGYGAEAGMTLRDYFAAAALTGIEANLGGNTYGAAEKARLAYKHADAMLQAREESNGQAETVPLLWE
jgi:hypothetical protein